MREEFGSLLWCFGMPLILLMLGMLLLQLNGTNAFLKKTQPTLLTGRAESLFTIPVAVLDQCFPNEQSKTFGIEFRLPIGGGNCKNGLLICYPSKLASFPLDTEHTYGEAAVNSELFNVDTQTELDKECQHWVRMDKTKNVAHWRGFVVYTELRDDVQRVIKLSKWPIGHPNSNQSVEIRDAQRQFVIHLGNENDPFAYVTTDFDDEAIFEFGEEDRQKRDAYKQLAAWGAPLKDFAGFWTLGLDMLPWLEDAIELKVARKCECSMEAWLIRPSDEQPVDLPLPSVSSTSLGEICSTYANMTFELINPRADHLINLRFLLYEIQDAKFHFSLLDKKEHLMDFDGLPNSTEICINGKKSDTSNKMEGFMFDVKIALTNYSYGIMINGAFLKRRNATEGHEFFPSDWWNGLPFGNMSAYQIAGNFLLLNDPPPPLVPFKTALETNYISPTMELPYVKALKSQPTKVKVKIEVNDQKRCNYSILLYHDRPDYHALIGATVMGMNILPSGIQFQSYAEQKKNNGSTNNDPKACENKFVTYTKACDASAMQIDILEEDGTIKVQFLEKESNATFCIYNNSLAPLWSINFFRVQGNGITLLDKPCIEYNQRGTTGKKETGINKKLQTVLNYGDEILFDIRITNETKNFSILLMHESLEFDKRIGDTLLALTFNLSPNTVQCKYFVHMDNETGIVPNAQSLKEQTHDLNENGQHFDLVINCTDNGFDVRIDDVNFAILCPYPTPKKHIGSAAYRYPPWAVDHIRFEPKNDKNNLVKLILMKITHKMDTTLGINDMRQINETYGVLEARDQIIVTIPVKELNDNTKVIIQFLHEALTFHPIIGKTIMKMELDKLKQLKFQSFMNNKSIEYNCSLGDELTKAPVDQLIFVINVMENGFNVTLNERKPPCQYNPNNKTDHPSLTFPPWAVHYITLFYQNVKLRNATQIDCVPGERCFKIGNETHNPENEIADDCIEPSLDD